MTRSLAAPEPVDHPTGCHSAGALLVVGATSGAGKSTVVSALCRAIARQENGVAPFKAQNMSNHAAVTNDGGEIGRAQAMQAAAAGVEPERVMNPILLKPTSDRSSHLIVLGDEQGRTDAMGYGETAADLRTVVLDSLVSLRRRHRWVIAEGAGGAAEINLLERDLVNLPLARAAGIPALLVVDIDRGGAFAAAHGTIDLLPAELRETVEGVVFNRFRGDPSLLEPGITELQHRSGVPVLGVLPDLGRSMLGVEDSLDVPRGTVEPLSIEARTRSTRPVRVAVVRFPHLANPSDLDPMAIEPDVRLRWVVRPDELADADLVVLPGSRATVADLDWLRHEGLAAAIDWLDPSVQVVGICAGYQMLGTQIDDEVESGRGTVDGLGLLDVRTRFDQPKIVRRSQGTANGYPVEGYQIRHGRPRSAEQPWLHLDGADEGARGATAGISGTSLHGVFDGDEFRTALLQKVADGRDRHYRRAPTTMAAAFEAQHDLLADWLEEIVDLDQLLAIGATAAAPEAGPGW